MGNYSVILSLLGCLDHGVSTKKLVDRVIDSCASGLNFHEVLGIVLIYAYALQVIMSSISEKTSLGIASDMH